ncbi:MAG: hypothetical protein ACRC1W_03460, partial [Shewanella sp.]
CGIKGFNYANFGWKKDLPIIDISSLKMLPQRVGRNHFICSYQNTRLTMLSSKVRSTKVRSTKVRSSIIKRSNKGELSG